MTGALDVRVLCMIAVDESVEMGSLPRNKSHLMMSSGERRSARVGREIGKEEGSRTKSRNRKVSRWARLKIANQAESHRIDENDQVSYRINNKRAK